MKNSSYAFLLLLLILVSCKKETVIKKVESTKKTTIKYAKGFDIVEENGFKKLIIKSAYKGSNEIYEYKVYNKSSSKNLNDLDKKIIQVPVKEIIVTSTTHIPMVELLEEEKSIVGFPFSRYVSSEKTRQLIDLGKIKEIGKENDLN